MGFFTGFVVGVVVTTLGVSGLLLWLNRPRKQSARAILRDKGFTTTSRGASEAPRRGSGVPASAGPPRCSGAGCSSTTSGGSRDEHQGQGEATVGEPLVHLSMRALAAWSTRPWRPVVSAVACEVIWAHEVRFIGAVATTRFARTSTHLPQIAASPGTPQSKAGGTMSADPRRRRGAAGRNAVVTELRRVGVIVRHDVRLLLADWKRLRGNDLASSQACSWNRNWASWTRPSWKRDARTGRGGENFNEAGAEPSGRRGLIVHLSGTTAISLRSRSPRDMETRSTANSARVRRQLQRWRQNQRALWYLQMQAGTRPPSAGVIATPEVRVHPPTRG